MKLVEFEDVLYSSGEEGGSQPSTDFVFMSAENIQTARGLEVLNLHQGTVTSDIDLNSLIKDIAEKQKEDRQRFIELAQKTIFVIPTEEF